MGTAIVVTCITFSLLFAAGVPLRPIAKTVGSVVVICVIAGVAEPYRRDRLFSFLNPFAHSSERVTRWSSPWSGSVRAGCTGWVWVRAARNGAYCRTRIRISSSLSSVKKQV